MHAAGGLRSSYATRRRTTRPSEPRRATSHLRFQTDSVSGCWVRFEMCCEISSHSVRKYIVCLTGDDQLHTAISELFLNIPVEKVLPLKNVAMC